MPLEILLLRKRIEKLRCQLIQLAAAKGSLNDAEVLEVSRKLDILLIDYQRIKSNTGP